MDGGGFTSLEALAAAAVRQDSASKTPTPSHPPLDHSTRTDNDNGISSSSSDGTGSVPRPSRSGYVAPSSRLTGSTHSLGGASYPSFPSAGSGNINGRDGRIPSYNSRAVQSKNRERKEGASLLQKIRRGRATLMVLLRLKQS